MKQAAAGFTALRLLVWTGYDFGLVFNNPECKPLNLLLTNRNEAVAMVEFPNCVRQ